MGLAGVVVLRPAGLLLYIDPHGAELVHHEGLFVEADALLLEDDRPGAGQFHTNGRDQHDRAGEYDQHQAADNIQPALDGRVEDVVKGRLAHIDELALVQHIDGRPGRQVVAVKRHHRDAGAVLITDGKGVGQLIDLIGFQRDHDLIQGGAFQGFVQLIVAAQIGHAQTRLLGGSQVAVHHKTVVGVMLQRAQVEGRRFAAAHQQDVPQAQAFAAAGTVHPAADHPLGDHGHGGKAVEQAQHYAGIVVQVHQVEEEYEHHDARGVDHGHDGAAPGQPPQTRGAVHTGYPVGQHQQDRGACPGNKVARVTGHLQRRAGAAGLKKDYIIKTHIVGQQKADEQQHHIQQTAEHTFGTLIFFQQRGCPPLDRNSYLVSIAHFRAFCNQR